MIVLDHIFNLFIVSILVLMEQPLEHA